MPETERACALKLRDLFFQIAAETPGVGPLHETLKWGQPAYLTQETGSGTTLRLNCPGDGGCQVLVHCQTSLIADFRDHFPDAFDYQGNRAIGVGATVDVDESMLSAFIRNALTYHMKK